MRALKEGDKYFTLYWRTGDHEIVSGRDIAEAMTLAGYSGGAARALDFWAHGDVKKYDWNATEREWRANQSEQPTER